jgi:opacity protein-like surface antigen
VQSKNLFFSLVKGSTIFAFALLSLNHALVAQSSNPAKDENFTPGTDISLGLLGQTTFARNPTNFAVFPEWTVVSQQSQSQSPSAGALVTFHGAMKPYLGYNVNFGYTRFTQTDSEGSGYVPGQGTNPPPGIGGSFTAGALDTDMYELTLAYAFYGPRSKRFRTIGQIGGGGLFFEPINASFAHQETRPAMVFGVGAEYDVSRHFSLRAEYRGLFYKMPDFGIDNGFPKQRLFTVTNTPAISLVYRLRTALTDQTPKSDKDQNFTPGADFSLGLLGQITFARNPITSAVSAGQTTYTQLNQSQSPSSGTLVRFHRAYRPYLGYNINFSYTRFTQINSLGQIFTPAAGAPSASFGGNSIDRRMYEVSAAYAFYGPRSKQFRSFGQLGAGELVFQPMHSPFTTELKSCAAMVFGVGGEYDVSPHFSIRAEYRGLLYRMPNDNFAYYFPGNKLYTVTNMPAISLVYHFRPSSNQKHPANGQWGPY